MVITIASYALQTPPRVAHAQLPGPKAQESLRSELPQTRFTLNSSLFLAYLNIEQFCWSYLHTNHFLSLLFVPVNECLCLFIQHKTLQNSRSRKTKGYLVYWKISRICDNNCPLYNSLGMSCSYKQQSKARLGLFLFLQCYKCDFTNVSMLRLKCII